MKVAVLSRARWLICSLASAAWGCSIYGADLLTPSGQAGDAGGGAAAGVTAAGGDAAVGGGGAGASGAAATDAGGVGGGGVGGMGSVSLPRLQSVVDVPPIEVDMTQEGARDWVHWGFEEEGGDVYNHKQGATSQLLDFIPLDRPWSTLRTTGDIDFKWSDGTPVSSALTTQGIFWEGLHQGFAMVVPAAGELRRLRMYVGVRGGAGELRATLSDPKAPEPVLNRLEGTGAEWTQFEVTLQYGLAAEASRLELELELIESDSSGAAVGLNGVTFDAP